MEKFGKFMTIAITWVIQLFACAVVYMFMWNWFIAPLGFPRVGYWLVIGINMTIKLFGNLKTSSDKTLTTEEIAIRSIAYTLVVYTTFGIGALVQLGI